MGWYKSIEQVTVVAVFAVLTPLVTIWSLNTLFNLDIAYTIWNCIAIIWLLMVSFGSVAMVIQNKKD